MKALVLTTWVGDGSSMANSRRPKIADDYSLDKWEDVTGQLSENLPPNPNLYVVEITCTDVVMASIEADVDYRDGVVYKEGQQNIAITNAEFARLRNHLQNKGVDMVAVGLGAGQQRERAAKKLIDWLRSRPKA